jgi:hypothetical protein
VSTPHVCIENSLDGGKNINSERLQKLKFSTRKKKSVLLTKKEGAQKEAISLCKNTRHQKEATPKKKP